MPRTINRFFVAVSATTALLLTPVTAFAATRDAGDGGTSGTDSAGQTYDDGTQSWPGDNADGDTGDGNDARGAWYIIDIPGTEKGAENATDADSTRSADPAGPDKPVCKSSPAGGQGAEHQGKHGKKSQKHPSGKKGSSKGHKHKHRKGLGRKHAKRHHCAPVTVGTTDSGLFHGTATK